MSHITLTYPVSTEMISYRLRRTRRLQGVAMRIIQVLLVIQAVYLVGNTTATNLSTVRGINTQDKLFLRDEC